MENKKNLLLNFFSFEFLEFEIFSFDVEMNEENTIDSKIQPLKYL
jgi:hypothetical protein